MCKEFHLTGKEKRRLKKRGMEPCRIEEFINAIVMCKKTLLENEEIIVYVFVKNPLFEISDIRKTRNARLVSEEKIFKAIYLKKEELEYSNRILKRWFDITDDQYAQVKLLGLRKK